LFSTEQRSFAVFVRAIAPSSSIEQFYLYEWGKVLCAAAYSLIDYYSPYGELKRYMQVTNEYGEEGAGGGIT